MTRKPKNRRPAEPHKPERTGQTAIGAAARLVLGSETQARRSYSLLAVCGFLLMAVIAVFGQTAGHDFLNCDDDEYVYSNRHVKGGRDRRGQPPGR